MNIGMCGLGKLGLPSALAIESKGHTVVGYDINPAVADYIKKRKIPYKEAGADELLQTTNIKVIPLADVIKQSEIIFVPVQTPHDPLYEGVTKLPDTTADFNYEFLKSAIKSISEELDKIGEDRIVIIISTVLPGTIQREIIPLMSKHVKLCYNPFFIAMGTTIYNFLNPEIVLFGRHDPVATEKAKAFYRTITSAPFHEMSIVNAELVKVNYNCYSDDTEVLTSNGWKLFSDIDKNNDLVLSINPETQLVEWAIVNHVVNEPYRGNMIHFHSKKDDVLVTPDHFMYIGRMTNKKTDGKNYSYNWKLQHAENVINLKSYAFCRSVKWNGVDNGLFLIDDGIGIDTSLFVEFLGWWLAEGSCYKQSNNSYQITISQSRKNNLEKYQTVKDLCKRMSYALGNGGSISENANGIVFYDVALGKYLYRLGKSLTKFIPVEVKELHSDYLRIMLNAMNLADGSSQRTRAWTSGKNSGNIQKYYSTSSPLLAADISELILKVGRHPSCRTQKSSLSNKPNYLIYELLGETSVHQSSSKIGLKHSIVSYDGNKCCVILDRNHVFLTRRNGKCSWHGNTFITMKVNFANNLMEVCHRFRDLGADVDVVIDALSDCKQRIISAAYMRGGMPDSGGCHPRDNIALADLARKLELSNDLYTEQMLIREQHIRWFREMIDTEARKHGLPKCILGKSYKPETNLTVGSSSLRLYNEYRDTHEDVHIWDPHVDGKNGVDKLKSRPHVFFIGTKHEDFRHFDFPRGSVVIDPFRYITPNPNIILIPLGKAPSK